MNALQRLRARGDVHQDAAFMADVKAAMQYHAPPATNLALVALAVFLGAAFYWMITSQLDIVTLGMGTVIPSSRVQIIQNLEGGILEELLVKEGALVQKDQVLAKINDIRFNASYREDRAQYLSLLATIARLTAEVRRAPLAFPRDVLKERPALAAAETELYRSRQKALEESLDVVKRSHEMVRRELEMSKPLVAKGAMSQVEILRLERQENELSGQIENKINQFVADAQTDLNRNAVELSKLSEATVANKDRVTRTIVRSPIRGVVKKISKTTIGGVIGPGEDIMEVVPVEDRLLIETHVQPDDIGFVHVGQEATVKIAAYDFTIFGSLPGLVEVVSADAIVDPTAKNQTFYKVMVRTRSNHLESKEGPLTIIPGMTATVNILTGKRTVFEYLLKPILRTREAAMHER